MHETIRTLYSSERDAALLALRPHIAAVDAEKVRSITPDAPAEAFLHQTLRPVLKLHNAVLLDLCAMYCMAHRSTLLQASRAQQQAFVQSALKRDAALRNIVLVLWWEISRLKKCSSTAITAPN